MFEQITDAIPSWSESLSTTLSSEIFLGLIAASLIGSAVFGLRFIAQRTWRLLRLRFTYQLQVQSHEPAYPWVLKWLGTNHNLLARSRSFRVHVTDRWYAYPGDGFHFTFYKGTPLILFKRTEDGNQFHPRETITLMTIERSRNALNQLLMDLEKLENNRDRVNVLSWSNGGWILAARKAPRSIDTVVLPREMKEYLVNDMQNFLDSKKWYLDRGIPYKRGYLFYGPPGTGKTSLAFALASYFSKKLYTLNLAAVKADSELQEAFSFAQEAEIILIEDVDSCSVINARSSELQSHTESLKPALLEMSRKKCREASGLLPNTGGQVLRVPEPSDDTMNFSMLSLSGILNVLDGVTSAEGRIIIMTTNDPSNFDSAFTRKGRIDVPLEIPYPGWQERHDLFIRFYPDHTMAAPAYATQSEGMSPPDMQSEFMKYPIDPTPLIKRQADAAHPIASAGRVCN
jgi:chaperone BCS1